MIFVLAVLLFRREIFDLAGTVPGLARAQGVPVVASVPVAVAAAAPVAQPQRVVPPPLPADPAPPAPAEMPAAVALPDTVPGPAPLPVVITPSFDTSRNVAVARRERNGQYAFEAAVNGAAISMLFDTGASTVLLRSADAARAGIDVRSLTYSLIAKTANGMTEVAPVVLSKLTVGTITRRNVVAAVALPGKLDFNLLGQSFLARVARFDMEGDRLVIRGGEWSETH